MSDIKTRVSEALKTAMKAQEKSRVDVLRMLNAAFKQVEVDERVTLDDARMLVILEKQIKQRRESVTAFAQGGRPELAEKESFEIQVLSEFLPAQLSDDEIDNLITETISATGASSARDMGRVMNELRPKLTGRADMAAVSQKLKARLS